MNRIDEANNKIWEIERDTINSHYTDIDFWTKAAILKVLEHILVTNAAILDELKESK